MTKLEKANQYQEKHIHTVTNGGQCIGGMLFPMIL